MKHFGGVKPPWIGARSAVGVFADCCSAQPESRRTSRDPYTARCTGERREYQAKAGVLCDTITTFWSTVALFVPARWPPHRAQRDMRLLTWIADHFALRRKSHGDPQALATGGQAKPHLRDCWESVKGGLPRLTSLLVSLRAHSFRRHISSIRS